MKRAIRAVALLLAGVAAIPVPAAPGHTKKAAKQRKQILIFARQVRDVVEYQYNGQSYSGGNLDYLLGEWHVNATKDSEVVIVLEDDLRIADIKDVPKMAVKAGFTDVRAFVYWKGTGNMAEVLFGPVVKVKKSGKVD